MTLRSIAGFSLVLATLATTACSGASSDGSSQSESAALSHGSPIPYLALGDSIAFGDNGYISWTDPARANAANFVGYPFQVAELLYGSTAAVSDLACPGETTGSFLSATAPDNGCHTYKGENPLHVQYAGTQMSAAIAYLQANPQTRLVTLTLGGNDLLLQEYACEAASNFDECVVEAVPGLVSTAAENVAKIMTSLREAGYSGDIVYLTQYATSYTDVTQLAAIPLFNTAIGTAVLAHGGKVASGFDTFAAASVFHKGDPCAAGLLIPNPDGTATCDKHPSPAGRNLLADAVALIH